MTPAGTSAGTLAGRRVLLVVSGGIAAYKALELVRLLRREGCAVEAVLTNLENADSEHMKAFWFHPKGPQLIDAFGIAVNEVVTGSQDAESALAAAAETMRAAIG